MRPRKATSHERGAPGAVHFLRHLGLSQRRLGFTQRPIARLGRCGAGLGRGSDSLALAAWDYPAVWSTPEALMPCLQLLAENLVHHLCALGERRPDLVTVDRFRGGRAVLPGQQRDALHGTPLAED